MKVGMSSVDYHRSPDFLDNAILQRRDVQAPARGTEPSVKKQSSSESKVETTRVARRKSSASARRDNTHGEEQGHQVGQPRQQSDKRPLARPPTGLHRWVRSKLKSKTKDRTFGRRTFSSA